MNGNPSGAEPYQRSQGRAQTENPKEPPTFLIWIVSLGGPMKPRLT
jgi:hypothetical protein